MRFYEMDEAHGFRQRGQMINEYDEYRSNTDDIATLACSLLVSENDGVDYTKPVCSGKFVRILHYPVNGEFVFSDTPRNYSDWYVPQNNSTDLTDIVRKTAQNKETYSLSELIYCLTDYPVRTSKTFTVGQYTFKEVLEICAELFFKPRYMKARLEVADNYALNVKNSELNYTNATLFDVVFDIGRQLDLRPYLELEYFSSTKTYWLTLKFRDKLGTADVVPMSDLNWADVISQEEERATAAGNVVSYVDNMITTTENTFPQVEGFYPKLTNEESNWTVLKLPQRIREVREVSIFWQWGLKQNPEGAEYTFTATFPNGEKIVSGGIDKLTYSSPFIITEDGNKGAQAYSKIDNTGPSWSTGVDLFLSEEQEYQYLYDVPPKSTLPQTKQNTIHYTRGEDTIDLSALVGKGAEWFYARRENTSQLVGQYYWLIISDKPDESLEFHAPGSFEEGATDFKYKYPWAVSVKYAPYIDSVLIGENGNESDVTVYFNQYGQVVDSQAFGKVVDNYAESMGAELKRGKYILMPQDTNDWQTAFAQIPKINSVVDDGDTKYVITNESIHVSNASIQVVAQLNPYVSGQSRLITADGDIQIYGIPNNNLQVSKSYEHCVFDLSFDAIPETKEETMFTCDAITILAAFTQPTVGQNTNNPLTAAIVSFKNENGANIIIKDENAPSNAIAGKAIIPLTLAEAGRNLIINYQMLNNRVIAKRDDYYVLYTDRTGKFKRVEIDLMNYEGTDAFGIYPYWNGNDYQSIISYNEPVYHDGREIYNQTTIVGFNGLSGLHVSPNVVHYCGLLGNKRPGLYIRFFDKKMSFADNPELHTVAKFDLYSFIYTDAIEHGQIMFDVGLSGAEMITPSQYESFAIMQGNDYLIIDNFRKIDSRFYINYRYRG